MVCTTGVPSRSVTGTTGKPKGVAYSHRSTFLSRPWQHFYMRARLGLLRSLICAKTCRTWRRGMSERAVVRHTLMMVGADQLCLRGHEAARRHARIQTSAHPVASMWKVVLPFVPMFHVLSWGTPFAMLMIGLPAANWSQRKVLKISLAARGARAIFTSRYMDPATLVKMMTDWKARSLLGALLAPNTSAARLQVDISLGVPTVWQGVKAHIELLDRTRESPHLPLPHPFFRQQGVEKIRQGLTLKRLTCGGSAPQPALMRWFYDMFLGVQRSVKICMNLLSGGLLPNQCDCFSEAWGGVPARPGPRICSCSESTETKVGA